MERRKHRPDRPPRLPDRTLSRIDEAWDDLESGNVEAASTKAEKLLDETSGHPEARFLMGAALLESGYPNEALELLEATLGNVDNANVHIFYLASTLLELARFEEAERFFRGVMQMEVDKSPVQYGLAQVLEHLDRYEEAEKNYEAAHRTDPQSYPLPTRMQRTAFEKVVQEAVDALPEEILQHLKNVPIVVQDLPERSVLLGRIGEHITPSVLGLFVGRDMRGESVFNGPDLPPSIFIYQRNLERFCWSREELMHEISMTLYHELGHYLGLDEGDLEARGLD